MLGDTDVQDKCGGGVISHSNRMVVCHWEGLKFSDSFAGMMLNAKLKSMNKILNKEFDLSWALEMASSEDHTAR